MTEMICSNYSIEDKFCRMGIPVSSRFVAYFCRANHTKCPYIGILGRLKGNVFSRRKSRFSEKIWKRP
ncbi:MAG: hypothetical protein ACK415_00805 [Thermodesulfovibrionales bacterium]